MVQLEMTENLREIVNGKLLPQFMGKQVSVTGLVTSVNPNGLSFEMHTTDNVPVKILMKRPNQGIIEGYVEVHGISQGQTVACEELIQFKTEEGVEFDVATHNSACMLLNSVPRLWEIK